MRDLGQAAIAMNRLAQAIEARTGEEKTLLKILLFKEDGIEDPVDWISEFE